MFIASDLYAMFTKLSPTPGGRSVSIVHLQIKSHGVCLLFVHKAAVAVLFVTSCNEMHHYAA
jgi:hypothetical protein